MKKKEKGSRLGQDRALSHDVPNDDFPTHRLQVVGNLGRSALISKRVWFQASTYKQQRVAVRSGIAATLSTCPPFDEQL